jgi:hypothetical protein
MVQSFQSPNTTAAGLQDLDNVLRGARLDATAKPVLTLSANGTRTRTQSFTILALS